MVALTLVDLLMRHRCRAVNAVESMVALTLADHLMRHIAQCELLPREDFAAKPKSGKQEMISIWEN